MSKPVMTPERESGRGGGCMTEDRLRKALGQARAKLAWTKSALRRDGVSAASRYDLMDEHDRLIEQVRELSDAVDALVYG